jgi:hypothetical protein
MTNWNEELSDAENLVILRLEAEAAAVVLRSAEEALDDALDAMIQVADTTAEDEAIKAVDELDKVVGQAKMAHKAAAEDYESGQSKAQVAIQQSKAQVAFLENLFGAYYSQRVGC